jgi:glutathione S-transferase
VLLIGMLDSPFVRRVAVSMQLLGMSYEHGNWSVGRDYERIRQYNPMVKVPTLVLDDGEVLSESSAILDYLDQGVGSSRSLLPAEGRPRREALKLMALAIVAGEKGRDQLQEIFFRPEDKRYGPWMERLQSQMHAGLALLDSYCKSRGEGQWLIGEGMTQADITATCVFTFLSDAMPDSEVSAKYLSLSTLVARCEDLDAFKRTRQPYFRPAG